MDFDEYDYLEKTVEDLENRNKPSKQKGGVEKTERAHEGREGS